MKFLDTKDVQETLSNKAIIPAHQWFAIEQRYIGFESAEIAEGIKRFYGMDLYPSSVRRWFMKGGLLHEYYRTYASEMNAFRTQMARDYFQANALNAAKVLAAVMRGQGGPAQVMAAKEFLERGLGKVEQETKLSGGIGVVNFSLKDFIEMTHGAERDPGRESEQDDQELAE